MSFIINKFASYTYSDVDTTNGASGYTQIWIKILKKYHLTKASYI